MIRLYHGTNKRIEHPDCLAGRDNLDFGKGFYTTLLREHAEQWAGQVSFNRGGHPVVNVYEFAFRGEYRVMSEQHRAVRQILLWQQIGCIVVALAKKLGVTYKQALDIFYSSRTNERLHDERTGLYLMGDLYIVDEVLMELPEKQNQAASL